MEIDGIELTEKHIGREVVFSQPGRKLEQTIGKIVSWDERHVMITFPISTFPHKCSPEKLKWRK